MPRTPAGPFLMMLAAANVCLHVAGLVLALIGMSPGTPLASLPARLEYLAGAPLGWTLGWTVWMICSALLIAFLAAVVARLGDDDLARLGLMIAVAGVAFDLFCDSVYIIVFPMIAAMRPPPETLFLTLERATGIASMVIANGAYSAAILLISVALRGRERCGPFTVGVGYAVAGFGLLLAGAGFTGVPWHAEWATPPTIGLFCVWVVLVARALQPAGRPR